MANSTDHLVPTPGEGDGEAVVVVADDAVRAGREVRARLDVGERAAGFVGDESADSDALAAFVADVVRPGAAGEG